MPERSRYPLYWRVKVIRPEWFGRRCRIVIHGGKGNRLIEFDNGQRVVCPGQYLRRSGMTDPASATPLLARSMGA